MDWMWIILGVIVIAIVLIIGIFDPLGRVKKYNDPEFVHDHKKNDLGVTGGVGGRGV